MTGKPKSHGAILLAVLFCTHPSIDATDKIILSLVAVMSDRGEGTNAHPGNRNFEAAAMLRERMVQRRIKKLGEAELMTCTEVGNGRGRASVYRLNLTNVHYPDRAPGGEWLKETPSSKSAGFIETSSSDEQNPVLENTKPRTPPGEIERNPALLECGTPTIHQKPTNNTPQNGGAVVGVACEKPNTNTNPNTIEKAKEFHKKCNTTWQQIYGPTCICRFSTRSAEELANLIEMGDSGLLLDAFTLYANDRFACGEGHDTWAVSKFISKADQYLLQLRPANVNTARIEKQQQLTNAALEDMGRAYGVDKPPAPEVPEDFDWLAGVE